MKPFSLIFLLAFALAPAGQVLAQVPSGGGPQPSNGPATTPIDGGATLLLASGAAYALKRLRRKAPAKP